MRRCRERVECRCVVQNLTIENLESQTFDAYIKFEASWQDSSEALLELYNAGYTLDDRIVKSECSSGRFVVRCADGSTTDALFAPRLMFKNRLQSPVVTDIALQLCRASIVWRSCFILRMSNIVNFFTFFGV